MTVDLRMRPRRPSLFLSFLDLTPLGHPLWWGALALLLINDNLFKGRGVPGWLTGKLSDFAFLIVAPTLFAALIPRRVPGRRTFAVAAVVALYVAADLSRAVSDAVVAVAARAGLHWRLWPDPTDLLALAVLPITVWLLRRMPRPDADAPAARRTRVQRERAGVMLGAIACIATSSLPDYIHHPFLFNRTATSADVRITWVLRKVPCATSPEALGAALGPSDLDDPRTVTLGMGEVAALDGVPTAGVSPRGVCAAQTDVDYNRGQTSDCLAAILETAGADPVLMVSPKTWWVSDQGGVGCCDDAPSSVSRCQAMLPIALSPGPDAVSLTDRNGPLRFTLTHTGPHEEGPIVESHIHIGPIDPAAVAARAPMPDGCRETRDAYHMLIDGKAACTSDGDCQALPALRLPGEMATCAVFVNATVNTAALEAAETQWQSICASVDMRCQTLPSACREGRCVVLCGEVTVPYCPSPCSYYDSYPNGICAPYDNCLNAAKENCTCENTKFVCTPFPPAGPSCPIGCLSDDLFITPMFHNGIDAGSVDTASDGGADAGAADGSGLDGGSDLAGDAPDAG